MTKSMYNINPLDYRRNGTRRPGAACDKVKTYKRTDDVSKRDRENREIVTKTMIKYVEQGVEPKRAAVIIANNAKVKKAFEYLKDAGVDLIELFVDFYKRETNRGQNNDFMR